MPEEGWGGLVPLTGSRQAGYLGHEGRIERLHVVVVRAELQADVAGELVLDRREDEDLDVPGPGIPLEGREEVAAVQQERTPSRPAVPLPKTAALCCPARDEADVSRDRLRAASQRRRSVEKLVERAVVAHRQHELATEQRAVDDLATGRRTGEAR